MIDHNCWILVALSPYIYIYHLLFSVCCNVHKHFIVEQFCIKVSLLEICKHYADLLLILVPQATGSSLGWCGHNVDVDPSPSNVKMLIGAAEEMLKQKNVESVLFGGKRIAEQSNFEKLDWFANELVLEHERRSCRIAPTVAFKQATSKSL